MRRLALTLAGAGLALAAATLTMPPGSVQDGGPVLQVEPTMNGTPPGQPPDPAPGRDACLRPDLWPTVWDRMDVFGQAYQFFAASGWSDRQLSRCFSNLRDAGKALSIAVGSLKPHCPTADACWESVVPSLRRMRALGADVAYLAIDEPLTTGHATYDHAVKETGRFVRLARQEFPGVGVILQEAYPHHDVATLAAFVADVDRAAESLTGRGIQYLQLDHDWKRGGTASDVAALQRAVRDRGVKFGVIFWRADPALTWREGLLRQAELYREYGASGVVPDMYAIINWTGSPSATLPEWRSPDAAEPPFMSAVRDFIVAHVPPRATASRGVR
jgi:hypothetical protein